MGRIAPMLVSLWWTSLLLIGLPAALIRLVGWPLPEQWPTRAVLEEWVQQPLTRGSVLGAAAVVGWLMWASFLAVVVVDAYRRAARLVRCLPDIRLPGPLQGLSAAMLGTVAVSTTVGAAGTPAAAYAAAATVDTTHPMPPGGSACSDPAAPAVAASVPAPRGIDQPAGSPRRTGTQPTSAPSGAASATSPAGDIAPAAASARRAGHPEQATLPPTRRSHTYTVHRGDNLSHIAADWLGDADRWPEIYHLNQGRHFPQVGGTLTNPNLIHPGWTLVLPDDARPPGHTPDPAVPNPVPPTGNAALPSPANPAPSPTATPTAGSPVTPSRPAGPVTGPPTPPATPSPSASAAASAVPSPSTSATTVPSSSASGSASAGTDRAAPSVSRRDVGVRLPGGWVPIPFAAALLAAAAMVWLRRRHRYIPGKLAGPVLRDPDLQPLPPAVTVLRRGVRRHAPDLLPTPEPTAATSDAARLPDGEPPVRDAATPPDLPPIGPSSPDLAGLGTPLPTGGLGLVGDGAHAGARAMLVATLTSGSPDDPDARGQVVIPVDALTTLLGVDAVNLGPTPRLTVTANLGEALTRLEELLIERRRILQDEDADDLEAMRAADPMHPPMPPVLLLAEFPDPRSRARLTTTLHLGTPLQINAVLLGDWPCGDTLDVDTEGYADTEDTDRLAVLDTTTTLQLLQVLSEAHTGNRTPTAPDPRGPSTMDDAGPVEAPLDVPPELDLPELEPTAEEGSQAPPPVGTLPVAPADESPDAAAVRPSAERARVPIRVLGRPALVNTGASSQALRSRAQELLVYLVVHRAGANLPDIKEAFWPDASNRRAGERLQTEVGDLRGRIRDVYGDASVQPVINTGGRYHLNPDLVDVDWWTVQDALAAATTDTADRGDHLRRAVAAFHWPLAQGCGYDWLPEVEEQVRRQGIIAYTQLAQLLADTDPDQAAKLLDQATTLDRYNEYLARAAMRAHGRLRDADAVRAQLHRIRIALDELDLEPDEATTTLATDLLRQITAPGPRPPTPPGEPPNP